MFCNMSTSLSNILTERLIVDMAAAYVLFIFVIIAFLSKNNKIDNDSCVDPFMSIA